ncbi:MAG: metallophosphoesterase [Lachnospiraceae bacterium]|nr:metallophosphoesterase [Lachnospiraceae bacterium]
MNILQITDLHLCEGGAFAFGRADTALSLSRLTDYILSRPFPVDLVAVTGDISTDGSADSYRRAFGELQRLQRPFYITPGNHDDREVLLRVYREFCPEQTAVRWPFYCIEKDEIALAFLDSSSPGQSGGSVSDEGLRALSEAVQRTEKPFLLFLHHAPFRTGYTVMDEPFPQAERIPEILKERPGSLICCGHIHAAVLTHRQGVPVFVCPPAAMLMEFDLSEAGGDAFFLERPFFALHQVSGAGIVSHIGMVPASSGDTGPYRF